MQQDNSNFWRQRGNDFEKFKILGERQRRPSQWRILQFALLRFARTIWGAFGFVLSLVPQLVQISTRRRPKPHENPFTRQSLGDLGDVHVKIHVDVDVEDA
jgi:hypothetical protein